MKSSDNLFEPVLNCTELYSGKYLNLERLNIQLQNGRTGIREVVKVKNAVAILPVDAEKNVYLVRQHRPAIGRTIEEIPAGLIDDGESAEESAKRECEEETGFRPGKIEKLITYAHAEGYSTGYITLFLGTKLEHTGKTHLDDTEFLEPVRMSFDELKEKVLSNYFIDSKTILATLLSETIIDSF